MTSNPHERAFEWSPDKIRWYVDASAFYMNDRNQKLASAILAELPEAPRVADVGCGVGGLSTELAKGARGVLSIELNDNALAALKVSVAEKGITNITPLLADFDIQQPVGEPMDGVALCMFGGMFEYVEVAERWLGAGGKVFYITTTAKRRNFSSSGAKSPHISLDVMRDYLKVNGFNWRESVIKTSFGQPFADEGEAAKFMRAYDKQSTDAEISADLAERLERTGDKAFPLYLPADKEYTMFVIERRD